MLFLFCSGCSIFQIREQSRQIGTAAVLEGRVINSTGKNGAIIVCLFKNTANIYTLVDAMQADEDGDYRFWREPGTYYIMAFLDTNKDSQFQDAEYWSYFGKPDGIALQASKTTRLETFTISTTAPARLSDIKIENRLTPVSNNFGKIARLDDQNMFAPEYYAMGMWRPMDFLQQIGGGAFFLEAYRQDRIPVLFFHGINGGPTDFNKIIASLDRRHYQPLMIYYPSGLKLDIISNYMVSGFITVQNRYRFDKFFVVAHSMGGLVARSFIKKYLEQFPERAHHLTGLITINSPLSGMPSAAYGASSPFMVQSWLDLVPDSSFLKNINNWSLPSHMPYYLIFSYGSGNSDGVVPLDRQLPFKQQLEATRVYGFKSSHEGTLSDPDFIRLFNSILSRL